MPDGAGRKTELPLGYERNDARFHNSLKSLQLIEIPISYTNQARVSMCAMCTTLYGTTVHLGLVQPDPFPSEPRSSILAMRAKCDVLSRQVRHDVEPSMGPTRALSGDFNHH